MTGAGPPRLPEVRPGRFWTAAVRRAVLAPELERYLSRKSVDLLVTDQIEALEVRVRKGIEVLEKKVSAGLEAALRRVAWMTACAVADLTAGGVAFSTGQPWLLAAFAIAFMALAAQLSLAAADAARLHRIRGRYSGRLEEPRTMETILEFAERALADARALGIVASGNEGEQPRGR